VAIDRNLAWEEDGNGIIFGGVHLSSAVATPTHTGLKGDKYFKTDGTEWRLFADGTNWLQIIDGGGADSINFSFGEQGISTLFNSSVNYVVIAEFIFPGTDNTGIPSGIEGLVGSDNASGEAAIKIFDRTNSLTIAEKIDIESLLRVVTDLGTLANLPSAPSVFEIQGKRIDGGSRLEIAALRILF